MKTVWTKGLEPDSKAEMKLHFNGSVQLRKRLHTILADKSDAKDSEMLSDKFDEGWAHKQAYGQGYRQALREIMSILN